MKKYKLKQWVQDVIAIVGTVVFMFTLLSCLSWSVKQQNQRLIDNKKTDTSGTYISQK